MRIQNTYREKANLTRGTRNSLSSAHTYTAIDLTPRGRAPKPFMTLVPPDLDDSCSATTSLMTLGFSAKHNQK